MTVWYLARGAGLAALVLLTVSTALGALMTGRGAPATRVVASYLHRVTASLGLAALMLHLLSILADSFAHVGWLGALVPLQSGYRPVAIAAGTLAAYSFLAVAALGFARGRMARSAAGARVWRWLHGGAYLGWALGMAHGLTAGTDTGVRWVQLLYVACGAAVVGAVAIRVGLERRPDLVRGAMAR